MRLIKRSSEIVVDRLQFIHGLDIASSICPKKSSQPVLCSVLLNAANDLITLRGTDAFISVKTTVKATTPSILNICIEEPTALLTWLILLKEKTVRIARDSILAETTFYPLSMNLSLSDFLPENEVVGQTKFKLNAADLVASLKKTQYATAQTHDCLALNGVYVCSENSILTFVGTDGKRLITHKCYYAVQGLRGFILPPSTCKALISVFSDVKEDITITADESSVHVNATNISLSSPLLQVTYPDYTKIIPDIEKSGEPFLKCKVHRLTLKTNLLLLMSIVRADHPGVTFKFTDTGEVSASYHVHGKTTTTLPIAVKSQNPRNLQRIFNLFFLLRFLDTISTDMVDITLWENQDIPTIFDSIGTKLTVMPITRGDA